MYIYVYICMYTPTHTYASAYTVPAQACSRSSARSAARRRRTSSPSTGQCRTPRRTHGVLPRYCTIVPPYPPGVSTSEPHAQSRAAAPPRVRRIPSRRSVVYKRLQRAARRATRDADAAAAAARRRRRADGRAGGCPTQYYIEYPAEYSRVLLRVLASTPRSTRFEYSCVPL